MSQFEIQNWKFGLDTRRSELTSQPGTLETLVNAHINQGGEVEKRKAFLGYVLPANTFGLCPGTSTVYVFGSVDQTGQTFPSFVTYQRLQHPDGVTAMTSVVSSTLFNGAPFVLAKFADGEVYAFYAGKIISDFYSGLATAFQSTSQLLATNLANLINAAKQYFASVPSNGAFNTFSYASPQSTNPYTIDDTVDSAAGTVSTVLDNTGIVATAPVAATAQFTIVAGTSNTQASGTLTSDNTNPNNNDTVTIGLTVYKFVTNFTGALYEIKIQNTADNTMQALINCINNSNGSGTTWAASTPKNTQVTAGTLSAHAFVVTAIVGGSPGNSIATTDTSAHLSWGGATLSGGDASDTNRISQVTVAGATNLLSSYVQFNQSVNQTAIDLVAAINANSSVTGYTATAVNNQVTITATVAGASPNGFAVSVTSAGNVCVDSAFFSTTPVAAQNISQISDGTTSLMTATITFQDGGHASETIAQFCGRVVANINANTGVSNYLACNIGNVIYLSKTVVSSTDATISFTVTSTAPIGSTTITTMTVALSTASIVAGNSKVVATVTNGLAPYSYKWVRTDSGQQYFFPYTPLSSSTKFNAGTGEFKPPTGATNTFVCQVTDSLNSTASSPSVVVSKSPL